MHCFHVRVLQPSSQTAFSTRWHSLTEIILYISIVKARVSLCPEAPFIPFLCGNKQLWISRALYMYGICKLSQTELETKMEILIQCNTRKTQRYYIFFCPLTVLPRTLAFKMCEHKHSLRGTQNGLWAQTSLQDEKPLQTLTSISVWKLKRSILCQLLPSSAKTFHACRKQIQLIYYVHRLHFPLSNSNITHSDITKQTTAGSIKMLLYICLESDFCSIHTEESSCRWDSLQ